MLENYSVEPWNLETACGAFPCFLYPKGVKLNYTVGDIVCPAMSNSQDRSFNSLQYTLSGTNTLICTMNPRKNTQIREEIHFLNSICSEVHRETFTNGDVEFKSAFIIS